MINSLLDFFAYLNLKKTGITNTLLSTNHMGISKGEDLDAKMAAENGYSSPRAGASNEEWAAFRQYKIQHESRKSYQEFLDSLNKSPGDESGESHSAEGFLGLIILAVIAAPFVWYFTLDDRNLKREVDAWLIAGATFLIIITVGILLLKRLNLFKRITYSFLAALIAGVFAHSMKSPTFGLYVDDLVYKVRKLTAGRIPPDKFLGRYWEHGYYNKPFNLTKEGESYILRSEIRPKQIMTFTYNEQEDRLEGFAQENGVGSMVYIRFDPDYGNIFITNENSQLKKVFPEHLLRYEKSIYD